MTSSSCCPCFQAKSPAQSELSEAEQFGWDVLFHREKVGSAAIDTYALPAWAGTWKIMNFPFRQEKKDWDHLWAEYQQTLSTSFDRLQQLEEEVGLRVVLISSV